MLRRPLATVLSSLSIRNALSTRLFCAPTIANDDQITTVRTNGIRVNDLECTKNGVYWGKGDPRNTYVKNNNDATDFRGVMLQSIVMALDQAKESKLKRVHVQTDFKLRDYRKTFREFMYSDFKTNGQDLPNSELYKRIWELMKELEVTFEYTPDNEVMKLLMAEKRSQRFKTPPESTIESVFTPSVDVDDQTPTARTTGMGWRKNGIDRTTNAVYWGEADPRNTIEETMHDSTGFLTARLRSIVIALEQAKKDGLKRIRVQTDVNMERYREMHGRLDTNDLMTMGEMQLSSYVMYKKIVELMNEMDVIIEYRSSLLKDQKGNEILKLVNEDKKRQLSLSFGNPIQAFGSKTNSYVFDRRSTSDVAASKQITIVQTAGRSWTGDNGIISATNVIFWGDSDSRNTVTEKRHDRSGIIAVVLQSIVMALEQAKRDGLKRIHVQTEFKWENYRGLIKRLCESEWTTLTEHELATYAVYMRIVEFTNEMEVTFHHNPKNQAWKLLMEGKRRLDTSLDSETFWALSPRFAVDNQITTVRTTSIGMSTAGKNSVKTRFYGVYWGEGDPRNTIERMSGDMMNSHGARLRTISTALDQAKKDGLKRIRVQTDFDVENCRELYGRLRMSDLTTLKDDDLVFYAMYEKCVKLSEDMEVIIERLSSSSVLQLLKDQKKQNPNSNASLDSKTTSKSDWIISPNGALSLEGRTIPTVYVAGRLDVQNENGLGSCVSLWDPKSIEHLEISQRPLGSTQRRLIVPFTNFRAQLMAIHDAIQEAQFLNLPEIRVITNSLHFLYLFQTGWQKRDGSHVANYGLYAQIKALTETIQVHFEGSKLMEESEGFRFTSKDRNSWRRARVLTKVHEMANELNNKSVEEPNSQRE